MVFALRPTISFGRKSGVEYERELILIRLLLSTLSVSCEYVSIYSRFVFGNRPFSSIVAIISFCSSQKAFAPSLRVPGSSYTVIPALYKSTNDVISPYTNGIYLSPDAM